MIAPRLTRSKSSPASTGRADRFSPPRSLRSDAAAGLPGRLGTRLVLVPECPLPAGVSDLVALVAYRVFTIGEAVKALSWDPRAAHPDVLWSDIARLRAACEAILAEGSASENKTD